MSNSVICLDSCISLANPLTGDGGSTDGGTSGGGVSRMQTAALFALPEPRRMAGRPVDWIVEIIVEGGIVDVVVRS